MFQSEFEKHRAAQKKALFIFDKKPDMKVIDLTELLLGQDPSLTVVIQVGGRKYSIDDVSAGIGGSILIIASSNEGRSRCR